MNKNKELEEAVLSRDLILTRLLLKSDFNIDEIDNYGRTILYYAIKEGYSEIVEELCSAKATINTNDKEGKSPLHFSAIHSQYESAKILIKHGAIVDIQDQHGNTPLSDAVFYSYGLKDIILLLLEKGANPNLQNHYEMSPKELAESISNYDLSHLFD